MTSGTGHRTLPHTADLIVEAWAPTRADCFAEAVRALVDSFAAVRDLAPARSLAVEVPAADPDRMLVDLLDEVVYLADTESVVPVAVAVADLPDGGMVASLGVVALEEVEIVGPAPKAVTLHGLSVAPDPPGWRAHVVVDV